MRDELDYRLEAANQTEFADHFAGHPFVTHPRASTRRRARRRVLTTEWVDGMSWTEFVATRRS